MLRFAELAVFLAPLAGLLLWRYSVTRGLDGPQPRQLWTILATLVALGGVLFFFSERDRLPPGRYVPAEMVNGRVVTGHTE